MKKTVIRKSAIVVFITLLTIGGITGAATGSTQSVDGEIVVSPTEVSLEQGESEEIAIKYKRLSDATPQGIEYTLSYDSDVISVVNQEQGSYLGGNAFVNNVSAPGEVEYVEAILGGDGVETVNGTIATITVEAASDIDDETTTPLEVTTAKASEGATEFTITTTNGTVEAEVPNQADDPTDNDSDSKETTDGDIGSEETTGGNADTEQATDDAETDSNRNEEINNSPVKNENRTESDLNETDTETGGSTASTQTDNDSSTGNGTTSENDTNSAIPGFGITLTLIAVLAASYIIGRKSY